MYFVDAEHEKNYKKMKLKFGQRARDAQYQVTIYAAALPEIYKCFEDAEKIDTFNAPLFELTEFNEQELKSEITVAGLTSSTRAIVEFALSLYNDHEIGLNDVLSSIVSEEYFEVLIQMMKIRAKK